MRYLVHSEDATFDSTDNKYYFNLDQRIANPTRIRVTQVSYTRPTSTTYPEVVYLRSERLSRCTKNKHTVELKDSGHFDSSDVVSTLTESHTQGRYKSARETRLSVFEHMPIQKLDFYFTDNRTILADSVAQSAAVSAGSDADMLAIGSDLICWTDIAFSRCYNANFVATQAIGDPFNYVYDRVNSDIIWALAYGTNMVLAALGQTQAMFRNGSWQSMADTTVAAGTMQDEFQLHFLFQQNAINDYVFLFYFDAIRLLMVNGALSFQTIQGVVTAIPNITIIPLQAYLVSVTRQVTNQVAEFHYRVEKLSDNSVQTSTTATTGPVPTQSTTWRLGAPNTHFAQYQGPIIIANTTNATHAASAQAWLRNTHDGTTTTATGSTASEKASFFIELEIDGTE